MEKYYKISESELVGLLEDSISLSALESAGVDNWWGYGENFYEVKKAYFPEATEDEMIDITLSDCAKSILTDYEEVED